MAFKGTLYFNLNVGLTIFKSCACQSLITEIHTYFFRFSILRYSLEKYYDRDENTLDLESKCHWPYYSLEHVLEQVA